MVNARCPGAGSFGPPGTRACVAAASRPEGGNRVERTQEGGTGRPGSGGGGFGAGQPDPARRRAGAGRRHASRVVVRLGPARRVLAEQQRVGRVARGGRIRRLGVAHDRAVPGPVGGCRQQRHGTEQPLRQRRPLPALERLLVEHDGRQPGGAARRHLPAADRQQLRRLPVLDLLGRGRATPARTRHVDPAAPGDRGGCPGKAPAPGDGPACRPGRATRPRVRATTLHRL